MEDTNIKEKRK